MGEFQIQIIASILAARARIVESGKVLGGRVDLFATDKAAFQVEIAVAHRAE
jgi:hypothetical protein